MTSSLRKRLSSNDLKSSDYSDSNTARELFQTDSNDSDQNDSDLKSESESEIQGRITALQKQIKNEEERKEKLAQDALTITSIRD